MALVHGCLFVCVFVLHPHMKSHSNFVGYVRCTNTVVISLQVCAEK